MLALAVIQNVGHVREGERHRGVHELFQHHDLSQERQSAATELFRHHQVPKASFLRQSFQPVRYFFGIYGLQVHRFLDAMLLHRTHQELLFQRQQFFAHDLTRHGLNLTDVFRQLEGALTWIRVYVHDVEPHSTLLHAN